MNRLVGLYSDPGFAAALLNLCLFDMVEVNCSYSNYNIFGLLNINIHAQCIYV